MLTNTFAIKFQNLIYENKLTRLNCICLLSSNTNVQLSPSFQCTTLTGTFCRVDQDCVYY